MRFPPSRRPLWVSAVHDAIRRLDAGKVPATLRAIMAEMTGPETLRAASESEPVSGTVSTALSASPRSGGAGTVSWASRVVMFGATSIVIGVLWDISWHRTIGRDTFWTPAHLAIYLGGLLGGLTAAWLIARTTWLASETERAGAVGIWGLRGPLGAWVCAWGSLAMLTSAPFDNWWHDAYGLDVKILSPPHTLLALGMFGIVIGALLLVLREQNLAPPEADAPGSRLLLYAGGVIVAMLATFVIEEGWPNQQRSHPFYLISAGTYPLYLVAVARASRHRWAATIAALGYMGISCFMLWVLPLFPGEPGLGPVYRRIDHFVPLPFPLLLVVPALGLDLLRGGMRPGRGGWRDWMFCVAAGFVFMALFGLAQWHFSEFLLSPGARNGFFGADRHWGYTDRAGDYQFRFWTDVARRRNPPATWTTFLLASGVAMVTCRFGLWLGNGMARVRR